MLLQATASGTRSAFLVFENVDTIKYNVVCFKCYTDKALKNVIVVDTKCNYYVECSLMFLIIRHFEACNLTINHRQAGSYGIFD